MMDDGCASCCMLYVSRDEWMRVGEVLTVDNQTYYYCASSCY